MFLRLGPLILALAGAAVLVVAEFSRLYEIVLENTGVELASGKVGPHHGYALAIVAAAAVPMALFAGRSRPAAFALLALALVALGIVLIGDMPVIDDEGLFGDRYEGAKARPETGFWLESAGAVLLVLGAAARLVLSPGAAARELRAPNGAPETA